ncbi:MAG: LysR family transcriptional regulator [Clostridia bacterium]|nr:LysR family transcriptional regulator [Clostridia bacterium]
MTIQQCKYIIAIAKSGSMNEAARSLMVSQASLSSAVRELEEEFGIRIFDRSNKGVRTTRDGSEFIRYARQLLTQYEVITDRYNSESKKSVCNFSVTSQHYDFVAKAFVIFMKKFDSNYNLTLKEARTIEVIDDVANLRSDVGVLAYIKSPGGGYMERYLKRKGLEYRQIFETNPHVFLGRHHTLAGKSELSLDDLKPYPYITYDQGEAGPIEFSEELAESNPSKKQIHISDRATLMNLLLSTDSYTIGTGIMSSELNDNGNVISVKLNSQDMYSVVLIHRSDVGLSDDAEEFLRIILETTGK